MGIDREKKARRSTAYLGAKAEPSDGNPTEIGDAGYPGYANTRSDGIHENPSSGVNQIPDCPPVFRNLIQRCSCPVGLFKDPQPWAWTFFRLPTQPLIQTVSALYPQRIRRYRSVVQLSIC
jgi:hypothetical protein